MARATEYLPESLGGRNIIGEKTMGKTMKKTMKKMPSRRDHPIRSKWHMIEQPKSNYGHRRDNAIPDVEDSDDDLTWFFDLPKE